MREMFRKLLLIRTGTVAKTKHLTLQQDIELLAPQNALTNTELRRKFGRDLGHSLNSNVNYRSNPKFSFGIEEIAVICGVKL